MPTSPDLRPSKRNARVALCELDDETNTVLTECFRTCDVEVKIFKETLPEIFRREKFEGCVVDLSHDTAEAMLEAARSSPSHQRIVLYGISRSARDIRKFSRYGVNVLIQQPIVRQDTLRAIRSSRLLLLNELRRYVRIPLATAVRLQGLGSSFNATTAEISGGGMSVELAPNMKLIDGDVRVTFSLPDSSPISLPGTVCWRNPELHRIGIRFEPEAPERQAVKNWIEDYLDLK